MSHLRLTPEGPPRVVDGVIPIDEPDEPMTEAGLRELELDRAADEGMIESAGPGLDVPEPEDEPRQPGDEVPGPEDEPHESEAQVPEVPGP